MSYRLRYGDQILNAFTLTPYTHLYIKKPAFADIRMFIILLRNGGLL